MGEAFFKVKRASAERLPNGGMAVKLVYPGRPEPIAEGRMKANSSFGKRVFQNLLEKGSSELADKDNPVRPPSAGSIFLFSDGRIVCSRRDLGAPTHKFYHSGYAGFPESEAEIHSAEGLRRTMLRETAGECLLMSRDRDPWLVIPEDSISYTMEAVERLGLVFKNRRVVKAENVPAHDRLEVYGWDGKLVYSMHALLSFQYTPEVSINALQIRYLGIPSTEVYPLDVEGSWKNGRFGHFKRESYLLDPAHLSDKKFGDVLDNPEVYQARMEGGIPQAFRPEYVAPYRGPDGAKVVSPHMWAPDDQLRRYLNALGVPGYDWVCMQLGVELMNGKPLLPTKSLAPGTAK
jgi:hypothetical protein